MTIDWQGHALQASLGDRPPAIGDAATAALRPERISLHADQPRDDNALAGRLVKQVFKGSRTVLDIAIGDDATVRAFVDDSALDHIDPDRFWIGWQRGELVTAP